MHGIDGEYEENGVSIIVVCGKTGMKIPSEQKRQKQTKEKTE